MQSFNQLRLLTVSRSISKARPSFHVQKNNSMKFGFIIWQYNEFLHLVWFYDAFMCIIKYLPFRQISFKRVTRPIWPEFGCMCQLHAVVKCPNWNAGEWFSLLYSTASYSWMKSKTVVDICYVSSWCSEYTCTCGGTCSPVYLQNDRNWLNVVKNLNNFSSKWSWDNQSG